MAADDLAPCVTVSPVDTINSKEFNTFKLNIASVRNMYAYFVKDVSHLNCVNVISWAWGAHISFEMTHLFLNCAMLSVLKYKLVTLFIYSIFHALMPEAPSNKMD